MFRAGSGPGVLVMTEMPGITPRVVEFANRVVAAGFTVWMPDLFGDAGRPVTLGYLGRSLIVTCLRREFAALAANRSGKITEPLRAMCRALHQETGGKGVGALGMCFTGNLALALMVDPAVVAPVLSQPSLPFPWSDLQKASIHVSPDDLAVCKRRVAEGVTPLALRFTADSMVPGARFETLRRELTCETIEIDSSPGNAWGIKQRAHSVLTIDLVDEAGHPTRAALDRVLAFFAERLH